LQGLATPEAVAAPVPALEEAAATTASREATDTALTAQATAILQFIDRKLARAQGHPDASGGAWHAEAFACVTGGACVTGQAPQLLSRRVARARRRSSACWRWRCPPMSPQGRLSSLRAL
jgi:hypothetical protein